MCSLRGLSLASRCGRGRYGRPRAPFAGGWRGERRCRCTDSDDGCRVLVRGAATGIGPGDAPAATRFRIRRIGARCRGNHARERRARPTTPRPRRGRRTGSDARARRPGAPSPSLARASGGSPRAVSSRVAVSASPRGGSRTSRALARAGSRPSRIPSLTSVSVLLPSDPRTRIRPDAAGAVMARSIDARLAASVPAATGRRTHPPGRWRDTVRTTRACLAQRPSV